MMRIDGKRLRVASDEVLGPVAVGKALKARAERRMEARLLEAAGLDVGGRRFWYALRTVGVSEVELRERLADSGVDAVVPVKEAAAKRRFKGESRKIVHRPVLRGLVFVNLVPSASAFAGLLRQDGVAALIGTGDRPHPIGDREMRNFMELAQAGAFDERDGPCGLKVGSGVRIKLGAFAEVEGVLAGYARGRTARVLTMLFGREMTVDVRLAHLEKLE